MEFLNNLLYCVSQLIGACPTLISCFDPLFAGVVGGVENIVDFLRGGK